MSFSTLKKNRVTATQKLVETAEKLTSSKNYRDDRLWSLKIGERGAASATIRFLPRPESDELGGGSTVPWVKIWAHSFKNPKTNQWYIENSRSSLGDGEKDPVADLNKTLWNTGEDSKREIAKSQKRIIRYFANIYVIKDPSNPENDGKVFLFRFGNSVFKKIEEALQPVYDDTAPLNPFDLWAGANFRIKARRDDSNNFVSYDSSTFDEPSEFLDGDDSELESVYNSCYSLDEFLDPKNYKSYDDLKSRLDTVLGTSQPASVEIMNMANNLNDNKVSPVESDVTVPEPDLSNQSVFNQLKDENSPTSLDDIQKLFSKLNNQE